MEDISFKDMINSFARIAQKKSLCPKDVLPCDMINSYNNMTKGFPKQKYETSNKKILSNGEESQTDNKTESNFESQRESNMESNTESHTDGQMSKTEKKSRKNKNRRKKYLPENVMYGQHKDFSFYECYAREIIFKLFNYPRMSFASYQIKLGKSKENAQISNWTSIVEKKAKNNIMELIQKMMIL